MEFRAHEYQKYAIQYILEHQRCCLMLDMGLGKTVITLTAINELINNYFEVSRVLVIAPLRVAASVWPQEIEKWDHLELSYSLVLGSEEERRAALEKEADVYIMNRENVIWMVENDLFQFDMTVVDESQSFKSPSSKRFIALRHVIDTSHRVLELTGTPTPKNLEDLWSQIFLLDKGERLGHTMTEYRRSFFVPDRRNRQFIYSFKPRVGAEEEIYEKIQDIAISMSIKDKLALPGITFSDVEVVMSEDEMELYETLKKNMFLSMNGADIDPKCALTLGTKLQQLASGSVYDDHYQVVNIHDRKLDMLSDLIEMADGEPVLVAYEFQHERQRIKERFPNAVEIHTPDSIEQWNCGRIAIGLIQPSAAGHGLNLQHGGHILIWFGLTYSLEAYQQCNARLYRQGQEKPVVVIHMITKDTIDEDIAKILDKKEYTQDELLRAVRARICE